jgi:hypothetical protein
MAYSKTGKSDIIFKEQMLHRYTHLGKRNFLHYAYNASKKYYINSDGVKKDGLDSAAIRKQLSRHFTVLMSTLLTKNVQRARSKREKTKSI